MTTQEQAALARITEAVKGKPVGALSYSEVQAADVVALGKLVPAPVEPVSDLILGATNAIADNRGRDLKVYQVTEALRRLLELVPAG